MADSVDRPWSDLFSDAISLILKNVGWLELLAIRGTCRNWRLASSSEAESLKKGLPHWAPWLLCQESMDKKECIMYHLNGKREFRMNLPELVGTNILGSFESWLLLHNPQSKKVCFFCPFSNEKICLPDLQQPELCSHSMSAVSSSPKSSDRTICIISRRDEWYLNLYLLRPGEESWAEVTTISWSRVMGMVNDVIYQKGKFFFFNKDRNTAVCVNSESLEVGMYKPPLARLAQDLAAGHNYNHPPVAHPESDDGEEEDNSDRRKSYISKGRYMESVKKFFSMDDTAGPVYIWGTKWYDRKDTEIHLLNESNVEYQILLNLSSKRMQRGIWIQPRLIP